MSSPVESGSERLRRSESLALEHGQVSLKDGAMKKLYGPSVSQALSLQRTPDAAAGFFLDAIVHCPGASPGTVKKWRKQVRLKEENDRLRRLRDTV